MGSGGATPGRPPSLRAKPYEKARKRRTVPQSGHWTGRNTGRITKRSAQSQDSAEFEASPEASSRQASVFCLNLRSLETNNRPTIMVSIYPRLQPLRNTNDEPRGQRLKFQHLLYPSVDDRDQPTYPPVLQRLIPAHFWQPYHKIQGGYKKTLPA